MTELDDRPTTEERYARAINSTHLRLEERRFSDADLLVAAGSIPDRLATSLIRLAEEYDRARGAVAKARLGELSKEAQANQLKKSAQHHRRVAAKHRKREHYETWLDEMVAASVEEAQAEKILAAIPGETRAERASIMLDLKSLAKVKQDLLGWATKRAAKWNFMPLEPMPDASEPARGEAMNVWWQKHDERRRVIALLTGRLLDLFLDDHCDACSGRKFFGGHGSPQIKCKTCDGSGRRLQRLSADSAEDKFAYRLLIAIVSTTGMACRHIGAFSAGRMTIEDLLRIYDGRE